MIKKAKMTIHLTQSFLFLAEKLALDIEQIFSIII